MKAVVLTERGKEGVHVQDRPAPVRKPGWATVRMRAASLNRVDVYMRDVGVGITHSLPQIMGVDGVGEVIDADPDSPLMGRRVVLYPYSFCGTCPFCLAGEHPLCAKARIYGEHMDGTLAETIIAPETSLVPLPDNVDDLAAASLGVGYLTAWRMVFGKAGASAGQTALVQGAGGGVAAAAIQLAHLAGCRVIATTSGANKRDQARTIGADRVIDYKEEDIAKTVLKETGGAGVDFVIDNVGEATWGHSLRAVKRGGRVVTCGATTGAHPSADLQRLFIRQVSVHGSTMGNLTEFNRLLTTFTLGRITPVIDSVFAMDEIHAAFDRLEHPDRFGKVAIRIA
jgi:NADPH:quinone reductase-like Zn-dependent oxidoreductase